VQREFAHFIAVHPDRAAMEFLPSRCAKGVLKTAHRNARCRFIWLHTSCGIAPSISAEIASRVQYLGALHTHLQESAQDNSEESAAGTKTSPMGAHHPDSDSHKKQHDMSVPFSPPMSPHCRLLPDSRLALVLSDALGTPLQSAQGTLSFMPLLMSMEGSTPAPSIHHQSSRAATPSERVRSMISWLRMSAALVDALQHLHAKGVVHRALHPSSVAYNNATYTVQFLDLYHSTRLAKSRAESTLRVNVHDLQLWSFMAPEQSGKSTRIVDFRSDLYSMGALLFFLATGRPPFRGNDAMELLHQHLARAPPSFKNWLLASRSSVSAPSHTTMALPTSLPPPHPPSSLRLARPQAVSREDNAPSTHPEFESDVQLGRVRLALVHQLDAIVAKLLQKQAEDRYASAAGLSHDLHALIDILKPLLDTSASALDLPLSYAADALESFVIGRLDLQSTFFISQKLYGRSQQVQQLRESYQCVCAPAWQDGSQFATQAADQSSSSKSSGVQAPHIFFISGWSGVGKTSLVDELHKYIIREHGLFARGKFDLLKRDSSCLIGAFRSLVLQMMTSNDALVWKVKLARALGRNAAALVDVIAELGRLLGPQPQLPPMGATDTANRLNMVLMNFVEATATAATPLILLIDDLQVSRE
jgi:serine/threonine protein kinase